MVINYLNDRDAQQQKACRDQAASPCKWVVG